jgi:hypothetical protein
MKKSKLLRVRWNCAPDLPSTLPHTLLAADERGDGAEALGLGKMFSDPNMFQKLAANPRTAKHLADASFMQKVPHSPVPPCPPTPALTALLFVCSSNSYSRTRSSDKAY